MDEDYPPHVLLFNYDTGTQYYDILVGTEHMPDWLLDMEDWDNE